MASASFGLPSADFWRHQEPVAVGVGLGVFATWWVGAILGLGLAYASRGSFAPKHTCLRRSDLLSPTALFCLINFALAYTIGLVCQFRFDPWAYEPIILVQTMHTTSYILAASGGLVFITSIILYRTSKR